MSGLAEASEMKLMASYYLIGCKMYIYCTITITLCIVGADLPGIRSKENIVSLWLQYIKYF